jgi:predicted RNase H-like HicB family nuclease
MVPEAAAFLAVFIMFSIMLFVATVKTFAAMPETCQLLRLAFDFPTRSRVATTSAYQLERAVRGPHRTRILRRGALANQRADGPMKLTAAYKQVGDWWAAWVEGKTLEEARENPKDALQMVSEINRELAEEEGQCPKQKRGKSMPGALEFRVCQNSL